MKELHESPEKLEAYLLKRQIPPQSELVTFYEDYLSGSFSSH